MPKCGYKITWERRFEVKSKICGDQASLRCATCKTYFCENHDILSDCNECGRKVRCVDCPEICKTCSDKSEVCAICEDFRVCEFYCEDCGGSNCGKCIDEYNGLECEGCGKLACCTPLEKGDSHHYYCQICHNTHTE